MVSNTTWISKAINFSLIHYASIDKEFTWSCSTSNYPLDCEFIAIYQIFKKTLHIFISCQRNRLFNRKFIKTRLWLNLKVLITFLARVITFLCSLLDDHFVTFLAVRCYISMQLFYYISMQVLLHFYAGITFLCKRITFLCRYYISMQVLHFYALHPPDPVSTPS